MVPPEPRCPEIPEPEPAEDGQPEVAGAFGWFQCGWGETVTVIKTRTLDLGQMWWGKSNQEESAVGAEGRPRVAQVESLLDQASGWRQNSGMLKRKVWCASRDLQTSFANKLALKNFLAYELANDPAMPMDFVRVTVEKLEELRKMEPE